MLPNDETIESVYQFIREYIAEHRYPPSNRDIADGCFLSSGSVTRYLDLLEATGRISRVPNQPRTIRIEDAEED